ncbi:F-box/kelch-repeat protein At3g23880-like [Vicia villosa]|uniref:F-box/kelch-repeat protein At3g23880-like n=1 Tax=Vicia villosa TaxID=3911 RepID=UPI00273A8C3A|nr:F-box/kelch-repeat protein At3g23880-like [Vicia villosa]
MMASPVKKRNPNSTMFNCDAVKDLLQFQCVANFWNSLIFYARKHFKRNPNIINLPPTLPFDLITEILSRLSVKLLLQFRCVCKSWNSLISDHKFARKHFNLSTTPNLHIMSYDDPSQRFVLRSYPFQSLFTDLTTNFTQLGFPFYSPFEHYLHYIVGSCDGILCLADFHNTFVVLWNPSIRKFKELPPFEKPQVAGSAKFGFGYDHLSHNYKVVVLYNSYRCDVIEDTTKIKVYNLRTNSWRSFQKLPFTTEFGSDQSGVNVSGTIN